MIWNFKKGNLLHILTYLTLNQLLFYITVCSIKEVFAKQAERGKTENDKSLLSKS